MSKRLGERLREAGVVAASAVDQALAHQKITGHRLGDCLVELGLIDETVLLRFLASEFKTRFVSAEKLAKARIGTEVLDRVPVRMCEAQDFLPIAVDVERKLLSVVMAEPQNESLVREIALVTEMTEVFAYVGIRSAIQAGIRKHYYQDPTAFAALEQGGAAALRADVSKVATAYESGDFRVGTGRGSQPGRSSSKGQTQLREALGVVRGSISETDYLETLTVLVNLLEPAGPFRGHSAQVARQARLVGRHLGLSPREIVHTSMAALLHEIGKQFEPHLTLLGIIEVPAHRHEAKRQARTPIKLLESVHLPGAVNAILAQVYEAFDGSGVPQGAKGDDISVGARIIAAVDAFLDLTKNARNPMNRPLPKDEAILLLQRHVGTLFDPQVVDALMAIQSGELLKLRLGNRGRQLVIADIDEGLRTDLLEALAHRGLLAQAVSKIDGLVDAIHAGEADTIAVGLSYGVNDLLSLTQLVRSKPETAGIPLLVLGKPTDQPSKDKLLQAGVTAFVPAPVDPESASARLQAAFVDAFEHGAASRVVRGSFDELSAHELLTILGEGKYSGRIGIRHDTAEGSMHVESGRIIFASWGEAKGERAVSQAFTAPQADFQYEPDAVTPELPNVDTDVLVLARQLARAGAT